MFHMLCMFGQLSPLLGDLKISLLRLGIACSRRHRFGFFGSLPVFFRSFHADALRTDRTGRVGFLLIDREQQDVHCANRQDQRSGMGQYKRPIDPRHWTSIGLIPTVELT